MCRPIETNEGERMRERKRGREREEEDRWAKRKDHRYIKETKINGGKEVECFVRNLQSGFYRGSMRETKIKKANQT